MNKHRGTNINKHHNKNNKVKKSNNTIVSSVNEETLKKYIAKNSNSNKKHMFINQIFKPTIFKSLVNLSVFPIILLGVIIIITVNSILTTTTDNDVEKNLQGSALMVLTAYNQNPGDYLMGDDGNLWKGSFNIGKSNELLKEISEASDIEISFFTKDKCIASTLDKVDKVPKDIKEITIDEECDFSSNNYDINGVMSYVYAITVYQERTNDVVGMIVVSADKESRAISRKKVFNFTLVVVILGIIVVALITFLLARTFVVSLKEGINSIEEVSSGQLEINFKKKYFKRKDEMGLMYRSVANLVRELRRMINNCMSQTKKIMISSEHLDHTAEKTKDSIEKVNLAMETMTETAESQFDTSNKVVENVLVLKKMIENTYLEIQSLNITNKRWRAKEERLKE